MTLSMRSLGVYVLRARPEPRPDPYRCTVCDATARTAQRMADHCLATGHGFTPDRPTDTRPPASG